MDVILVDENDVPVGHMEKLEVHQKPCYTGLLVFLFLTVTPKCFCIKEQIKNIIVPGCGLIPAVAIRNRVKTL